MLEIFKKNIQSNSIGFIPISIANRCVIYYIVALLACTLLFFDQALPFYILVMGLVSILLFFYGGNTISKRWAFLKERRFLKNVFWTAFAIRMCHIIVIVVLNYMNYGTYYESSVGDIDWYVPITLQQVRIHHGNYFTFLANWRFWASNMADTGYQAYLALVFILEGVGFETPAVANPDVYYIWLPLLLKAIYGSLTCVFVYKIASRHFDNNIARLSAIFCMLQWNMIWWCGSMMKETEMVFLFLWFASRMDSILYGKKNNLAYVILTVLLGLLIFTFRTALCVVAFAAALMTILMTSQRVIGMGKRILAAILILVVIGGAFGDMFMGEINTLAERATSSHQKENMEFRATRKSGFANKFAKYAGTAVFAPLIFTLPFPSMVYTHQNQEMQMQVNGGNFEKNVLSVFVAISMLALLVSGKWKQHIFPIALLCGYCAALALSEFAHSGRFHQPAIPLEMMFAAYGMNLLPIKKTKTIIMYIAQGVVALCIWWSWFKLRGQGFI